jgi:hypothetical protein
MVLSGCERGHKCGTSEQPTAVVHVATHGMVSREPLFGTRTWVSGVGDDVNPL